MEIPIKEAVEILLSRSESASGNINDLLRKVNDLQIRTWEMDKEITELKEKSKFINVNNEGLS